MTPADNVRASVGPI